MILRMAGVNHFDPTGPAALTAWFKSQEAKTIKPPLFIATEWAEEDFACIRGQRSRFRLLLAKEWPHVSGKLLNLLEQTLAYEGDSHLSVFPEAQVVWLVPMRGCDDPAIREYAEHRVNVYRSFLEGATLPADTQAAMQVLCAVARRRVEPAGHGSQRDLDFAHKVMDISVSTGDGWAAVVVGANHVADVDGSMKRVLQDHGYQCDPTVL